MYINATCWMLIHFIYIAQPQVDVLTCTKPGNYSFLSFSFHYKSKQTAISVYCFLPKTMARQICLGNYSHYRDEDYGFSNYQSLI